MPTTSDSLCRALGRCEITSSSSAPDSWSTLFARLVGVLTLVMACSRGGAAEPAASRVAVEQLGDRMREAGSLYSQAKYPESAEVVREVQQKIQELAADADEALIALLDPVYRRVVRAHALLELEGVELPPLKPLKPTAEAPAKNAAGGVSFVKQVAPILVSKCGRCHVEGDSGGFRMSDFESLVGGSAAGVVLFPGNPAGSRMVELIEVGDMPRGGLKVTADELAILKRWIEEGAKFDGDNPRARLSRSAASRRAPPPSEEMRPAASDTAVSFARDIAPLFAAHCSGCHVGTDRPRGRLNLTTFAGATRGGENGPAINAGQAETSLLVRKIKGTADGQRMPVGRPPLTDPEIATFEKWIDAGATFDGADPQQDIRQLAARAKAESATHETLVRERSELAEQNWALGMPSVAASKYETENLLLLGDVGEATLADLGDKAERLVPRIREALGAPADGPWIKGRMTLFVFQQRYDYGEFGRMVEQRELPKAWRGHWQFNVVDAYGALVAPGEDSNGYEALVAQLMAAAYVASLDGSPRWFANGAGCLAVARIARKDERVQQWDRDLPRIVAAISRAEDFLEERIPREDADAAHYGFAKFLAREARRYARLLQLLREGQSFDEAFSAAYGRTVEQMVQAWAAAAEQERRRKG